MAYQASFAVVTATLIAGAIVDRMRFGPYLAFIALWTIFVYAPIAHWVWGGGWLSKLGVLDFAGGTVVHINAGVAATVAALVVGKRKDYGRQAMLPHNVPFALLGAALLYFGWFGFNARQRARRERAAPRRRSPPRCSPRWPRSSSGCLLDYVRTKRATAVGAATAIVVGLVVITPAAGFVSPQSALAMGALGAIPSYYAIMWRSRTRLDDSLDVLAGHGVGGITRRAPHRRVRRGGVGRHERSALRQPGPGAEAGHRRRRNDRLQRRRQLRPPQGHRHGQRARGRRQGAGTRHGHHAARRRGVRAR